MSAQFESRFYNKTERDERIIKMHLAGQRNQDIVLALGLTRNAVAGVLSRWRTENKIPAPVRSREGRPIMGGGLNESGKAYTLPDKKEPKAKASAGTVDPYAPGTFAPDARMAESYEAQVNARTCGYIGGDPRDSGAQFCGEGRRNGSSYCEFHHALCLKPNQPGPVCDE